jgi:hypothetical protein
MQARHILYRRPGRARAFALASKRACDAFFPLNIHAETGSIAGFWSRICEKFARENRALASDFASLQFSKQPSETGNAAQVRPQKEAR